VRLDKPVILPISPRLQGLPAKDIMDEEGISMEEFRAAFEKGNEFASGIGKFKSNSNITVTKTRVTCTAVNHESSIVVTQKSESVVQGDGIEMVRSTLINLAKSRASPGWQAKSKSESEFPVSRFRLICDCHVHQWRSSLTPQ
jgi:hypothetical protein